jgi:hypothetical protein
LKTIVVDACILIDLHKGNILHRFMGLNDHIYISHTQLGQLYKESGPTPEQLQKYGIIPVSHPPDEVREVEALSRDHGDKHSADLFAYVAARRLQALLLTGDKRLAAYAQSQGVESRGLLWVFDVMVNKRLLSKEEAYDALVAIRKAGCFLPEDEVVRRLSRWKTQ